MTLVILAATPILAGVGIAIGVVMHRARVQCRRARGRRLRRGGVFSVWDWVWGRRGRVRIAHPPTLATLAAFGASAISGTAFPQGQGLMNPRKLADCLARSWVMRMCYKQR